MAARARSAPTMASPSPRPAPPVYHGCRCNGSRPGLPWSASSAASRSSMAGTNGGTARSRPRPRLLAGSYDPALEQEAAIGVGDGQRITALAVRGTKPALKIGTQIVRSLDLRKRPSRRSSQPAPARAAQTTAAQQIADRAGRRNAQLRMIVLQHRLELGRPPIAPSLP